MPYKSGKLPSCSDFLRFYIVPHDFEHAESSNDCDFDQKFREPFEIRYIQNNPNSPVHFHTKTFN